MRRACLAIGVSRAEKLDRLPAAATAAEEVGLWARQSGFADPADVIVLTDAKQADGHWQPVTVGRIRAALDQLFAAGSIDTLVLQFTGHGMRGSIGQAIWLPTDWESERRAINVELLKKNLGNMGVANLTIFGDACKSSARDLTPDDLTPDGVLGRGTTIGFNPKLDRFDAVHEGMSAFMVPGATPAGTVPAGTTTGASSSRGTCGPSPSKAERSNGLNDEGAGHCHDGLPDRRFIARATFKSARGDAAGSDTITLSND